MKKFTVTLNRQFHQYQIPLPVRRITLSGNYFSRLEVFEEQTKRAEIFISTLPDFHEHSDIEIAVKIKKILEENPVDFDNIQFDQTAFNMIALKENLHPEVLYHLECLLFLLLNKPSLEVKENGLYSPKKSLESYRDEECLKIKISPDVSPHVFSTLINSLLALNDKMKFRLDGNQRFEGEFLFRWLKEVQRNSPALNAQLDYIEEPFRNFADIWWAIKIPRYTLAIDESFLAFYKAQKISNLPAQCPWIIKPSLLGISNVVKLLQEFPQQRIIISSSFDHTEYKNVLTFLAAYRPLEFHGLSVSTFLVQ